MVLIVEIESTTYRLQGGCSAYWAISAEFLSVSLWNFQLRNSPPTETAFGSIQKFAIHSQMALVKIN